MDKDRREKLRIFLQREYKRLYQEIDQRERELRMSEKRSMTPLSRDNFGRFSDTVAETIQEETALALLEAKRKTLRKIEEALKRLERGKYGKCAECGADISEQRLQALPFAVRCRDCEAAKEKEL